MRRWVHAAGMVVVMGLVSLAPAVAQTTAYVTDELEITMRSGQGNDYRIIRLLSSGAQLEVLQRGDTWTRVRTGDDEGWVRSIYLQSEPGAATRLARASEQLERLRQENGQISDTLARVESELETVSTANTELEADNQRMSQRLQEADEGLQLADENKALRKQVIDLERQVQDLSREAERMADRERQDWFIAGAGVIVFGMLLGILVTRIRWRKRSSWGDL
ncbi:TIGR04211 family SH3 domain-containing protein [Spiribacter insolitus]|uniref:TIGR04211 family SH3 domain-containing protein n=1 Tax=Spiribacter insolitus TaxID=3122417 RepID=A0ABV3TB96_9GAMM